MVPAPSHLRVLVHLIRRFFGALDPRGPEPEQERWAAAQLLAGEQVLWDRMSNPDRRHAVGVAEAVAHQLGASATRPVLAAALLHDVGKIEARLGTFGRVPATLLGMVARDRLVRSEGRLGRYLRHDVIGGRLLADAGSDGLTVDWAVQHHLPRERWSIPAHISSVLKAADDD